jgi:hypothetical protein
MTKTLAFITLLASVTPALATVAEKLAAHDLCTALKLREAVHLNDRIHGIRKFALQHDYMDDVAAEILRPLQREALKAIDDAERGRCDG